MGVTSWSLIQRYKRLSPRLSDAKKSVPSPDATKVAPAKAPDGSKSKAGVKAPMDVAKFNRLVPLNQSESLVDQVRITPLGPFNGNRSQLCHSGELVNRQCCVTQLTQPACYGGLLGP